MHLRAGTGRRGGWLFGLGFCSLLLSKQEPALQGGGVKFRARVQGVEFRGEVSIISASS